MATPANNTPATAEIYADGTYLANHENWHVETSPWKAKQILNILKANGLTPATVAEVGCGAGEILVQMAAELPNTTFTGYELSPHAFAMTEGRASKRIRFKQADPLDDKTHYNCMVCADVFEHVDDYIGFIKALKTKADYTVFHIPLDVSMLSVLKGGMLAARKSVGHLHYFMPETALATIEYCGYQIIDHAYTKPFSETPSPTLAAKVAKLPRQVLYAVSPNLMAKTIGGTTLVVLAK